MGYRELVKFIITDRVFLFLWRRYNIGFIDAEFDAVSKAQTLRKVTATL
jgi:hypothetical protein